MPVSDSSSDKSEGISSMNTYYALSKNLTEAASYKLVRRSDEDIVFANGSILGWLFFLVGSATLFLLVYSGYLTHLLRDKQSAAFILLGCTSAFFTVFGFLAGIGHSKFIIDLPAKTYTKKDLSFKGINVTTGPITDISASVELKTLIFRGGEHDLYIAKIISDNFKEIIIAVTMSRKRIDDLLEILRGRLNISVIETDKRPAA